MLIQITKHYKRQNMKILVIKVEKKNNREIEVEADR